jgi:tetratricopeptide (TPR) repeat protein
MRFLTSLLRVSPIICFLTAGCNHGANYYLQHGNELFNSGKFEEASISYRKAIQQNPKFGEAFYRLGLCETQNHLPMNAYVELKRAAELMPGNETVLAALGELAVTIYTLDPEHPKNVYEQASKIAQQLLSANRDGFEGNKLNAAVLLLDRKPAEAVACLRKALAAKPGDKEASLGLAQALLETGQEKEGVDLARGVIRKDETYSNAYDLLYRYYIASRNPQAAEEIVKLKVSNNPNRGDFVLQLAALYAALSKPEMVSSTIQVLIDRPAAFPNARLGIGDFYNSLGKPDEALKQYEAGVTEGPKDTTPYRMRMIRILASERKWPEAYAQVDLLLKERPDNQDAKLAKASLWLDEAKTENLEGAISEFRHQLASKPANSARIHFQLGSALEREGDREGARREWTAALQRPGFLPPRYALAQMLRDEGRPEEALKISREIMEISAHDEQSRLLYATCLTATARYPEARAELIQLRAQYPQSPDPRYQLAVLDVYTKKYAEAEAAFQQLRTQLPANDYRAVFGIVESYCRQNKPSDAIRLIQEELKRNPNSIPLHDELARRAIASGAYDLAIEQYRILATLSPGAIGPQIRIIQAYMAKGDQKTAMEMVDSAVRSQPRSVAFKFLQGEALEKSGQQGDAKEVYRSILTLQNDNAEAMNNLAFLMVETGDNPDEALKLAKGALLGVARRAGLAVTEGADPNGDALLAADAANSQQLTDEERRLMRSLEDTIGWIYVKKKMYDSAVRCFQVLLKDDSANPVYHYHIGAALLEKGDKQKAGIELNTALTEKPEPSDAAAIRKLMARL